MPPIKFGAILKVNEDSAISLNVNAAMSKVDREANKKGYKRIAPLEMRMGYDGSDFTQNMIMIVVTGFFFKCPRIANPLYKKA